MLKSKSHNTKNGFIALLSVVLISSILLGLTFTLSRASFGARTTILSQEFKHMSKSLADSCADEALLRISQNYTYSLPTTTESIRIDTHSCSIRSIVFSPENSSLHQKDVVIETDAVYQGSWSRSEVQATIQNPDFSHPTDSLRITINAWKEK